MGREKSFLEKFFNVVGAEGHPYTYEEGSRVMVKSTNVRYAGRAGTVVQLGVHKQNDLDEYKIFLDDTLKEKTWFYAHELQPLVNK